MRMAFPGLAVLALVSPLAAAADPRADVEAGSQAWNRGDYAKAVELWRGPAIAGDPLAQYNMGQAYKLGRGVPIDTVQAEAWYAKSAAQGFPRAIATYGLFLFQDGRRADARPWLEKAVALDEPRAELVLGTMFFNGDGVDRDWVRAYGLVSRAQQQGITQAGQTLSQLDGYVTPEQREAGTKLAQQLAAQTHPITASSSAAPVPKPTPTKAPHRPMAPPASSATEAPPSVAAPTPRKTPVGKPTPTPAKPVAAKSTGRFRIQLGAFKDEANARALWAKVGGKTGGQPFYVKAGALTRLQAGPFPTEAEARRACHGVAPCDLVTGR